MDFWASNNPIQWSGFTLSTNIEILTMTQKIIEKVYFMAQHHLGYNWERKHHLIIISPNSDNKWNGISKDAEQKLLRLLLKETENIYRNTEIVFTEAIKSKYKDMFICSWKGISW